MAGPIYTFSTPRFTEAWYQLSEEEQDSLLAKVMAIAEKCGTKVIILCRSFTPEWPFFQVNEFADIESMQKNQELNDELNWHRYIHSGNVILGTKWDLT